ncbi:MAG TPA: hypothetical protein VF516_03165 [Kofleriaceae bacterium]
MALRAGRIAGCVTLGLAFLAWAGMISADEPLRIHCVNGRCSVPQKMLVEMLQRVDAAAFCGWRK